MIRGKKNIRTAITALTMCALISVGSGQAFSAVTTQKKTTAKPAPKTTSKTAKPANVAPSSPYDAGYQGGYGAGYGQGTTDWRNGVPQDFKRSDAYQNRERNYDATKGSLEEYRQGYDLGFELGYLDGYYGRARNQQVPANGA